MNHQAIPYEESEDSSPFVPSRATHVSVLLVVVAIACVLAIQFGYTAHLSVAGACFAIAAIFAIRKLTPLWLALGLVGASMIVLPHLFAPDEFHIDGLYRSLREAACFFVIVNLKRVTLTLREESKTAIKWGLWTLMIAVFVLTALQAIDLQLDRSGQFFVPSMYYPATINSTDCWTSSACWLAFEKVHGLHILMRPCATFAEPSYLGFVVLCLFFVSQKLLEESRWQKIAFLCVAMATVLLAQTASGILALVVMLVVTNKQSPLKTFLMIVVGLIFMSCAVVFMNDRWTDISNGSDSSSQSRLTQPLSAAGTTLAEGYVFGLPSESLGTLVPNELTPEALAGGGATDNALINLFILYGVVGGTVVLTILLLRCSVPEIFLLLLAMQFNGAFFWYDKVVLLSLALMLTKARFANEV
jgi:hypothetical protein